MIDPTLAYSTFLGGVNTQPSGLAVDSSGNLFVSGITTVSGFPAKSSATSIDTAFVAELTPAGDALVYATLLGGSSGHDDATGIAVDASGDAFVTGMAVSTDFPISANAYQSQCLVVSASTFTCRPQAFLTELNPAGTGLLYSSYFGGTTGSGCYGFSGTNLNYLVAPSVNLAGIGDYGESIAVDGSGMVYVEGTTCSTDLPTTPGVFQSNNSGLPDVFAAKFNPSLSGSASLVYSTYLGSSGGTFASGIAVDSSGYAYLTGLHWSNNSFPTSAGAYQTSTYGSTWAAFITKINPSGTSPVYSTLIGAPAGGISGGNVGSLGIAVDSSGAAYITGVADYNFPTTANAYQTACNSVVTGGGPECTLDAFVFKLSADGGSPVYSTYFGGDGNDQGLGIAVDGQGDAFITGATTPSEFNLSTYVNHFPTTADAIQPSCGLVKNTTACSEDAFLAELDPNGTPLYSSFLGGSLYDAAMGIALDSSGNPFVVGYTNSGDFPTTQGAYRTSLPGSYDAFVSKFVFVTTPVLSAQYSNPGPINFGAIDVNSSGTQQLVLTNTGSSPFTISGISLSGSSTAYSVTNTVCNGVVDLPFPSTVSLGGGQSCTFTLQFAPTLSGAGQSELLTILDTATGSNASPAPPGSTGQSFLLMGDGVQPFATFSPANSSYNLGNVTEGQSATQAITLSNTGTGPLLLNGVSFGLTSSPGFSFTDSCTVPVTISPGSSCTVTVQFAPTTTLGLVSVSLAFADNAGPGDSNLASTPGNPYYQVVSFTGTGVAPVAPPVATFSPSNSSYNLGNVIVGQSAMQAITLSNTGTGPLMLNGVTFGLSTSPGFSFIDSCTVPVTISPGSSCTVMVKFAPTTTLGLVSVSLAFADNAGPGQSDLTSTPGTPYFQVVSLSGTGITAPPPSDFTISASSPVTVTAGSSGTSTVTVSPVNGFTDAVNLSVSGSPAGVTASFSANPITGGSGTSTLTLATAAATPTGTSTITVTGTDASGSPSHSTTLSLTVNAASGGGGVTPPACGCSKTGNYVAPNNGSAPATLTVSGGSVTVTSGGKTVFTLNSLPSGTAAGLSPDNATLEVNEPSQGVSLYSLTSTPPGKLIGPSPLIGNPTGAPSRIQFSPSGQYLAYTTATIPASGQNGSATIMIYNVRTGTMVYENSDFTFFYPSGGISGIQDASGKALSVSAYGTVGDWGFSPDKPETSFVYGFLTGANSVQWNLVHLEQPLTTNTVGHANTIPLTNITAAYWQFSPCGDAIGIVTQPGGSFVNIQLIRTANGGQITDNSTLPVPSTGQAYILSSSSTQQSATLEAVATGTPVGSATPLVTDNSTFNLGCSEQNTPTGASTVQPVDSGTGTAPVTLSFSDVTSSGQTSLTITPTSGTAPPLSASSFELLNPTEYFNVSTTATFSGTITICFNFSGLTVPNLANLQLQHYDETLSPPNWVKVVALSSPPYTTTNTICGTVNSLSPFALVQNIVGNPSVQLITTQLSPLTIDGNGNYVATLEIQNKGNVTAIGTELAGATLVVSQSGKAVSTPTATSLPAFLGDIGPNGSATIPISFPPSAGAVGSAGALRVSLTYSGGSASGTLRLTLP